MAERAAPKMQVVPKGTEESECTGWKKPGGSCRATIYWIERPRANGKGTVRDPIDCDAPGCEPPDAFSDGRGITHYATCPDAKLF